MKTSPDRAHLRSAFTICLRKLRKSAGIAQERLALESDIDRGYMGQLERGHHSPSLETLYKLFPPLGITFTQFAVEYEKSLRCVRRTRPKL